ncbi:GTP-dependent dephospho-CoA kinase family protein [Halosolutus gelatinilyticus]|uniref:GTP-dependent dephospho-CoA kinase family protein n=1 Tax=Halosolutus gelatinilyticus TaxID=2931975 RepID=UPI001FF46AC1|nr:GTP-dependent dephospho-CoA kinase family protein [Halosolutus gelatinilyticus]
MSDEDDRADAAEPAYEPLLVLPDDLRHELKEPLGPIETDADVLLNEIDGPLITVGDVVTYHFLRAGRKPDVAFVDERTKRSAVDDEIRRTVTEETTVETVNPPAEISADVIRALRDALERDEPTTVLVEGEEDLVALPAIAAAPEGASVVYGQPNEGMVHVRVTDDHRAEMRALLDRFEGNADRLWELLDASRD